MQGFRFSVLVTALITLVSFCAARTVITIEKCTTRSCGLPVKVYRTTKTVRAMTPYTITRWKTVTKPGPIHASPDTFWQTWKTETVTLKTVTSLKTVWVGTRTHTRTIATVRVPSYTATAPITTLTITPTTVLAPIPSGIVGINQDPDNKAAQTLPVQKRNAEPDPAAAGAKKYPSAVICTKTLLTKTGTSDLWKTTTKFAGPKTVRVPGITYTIATSVTAKNAKTIVVTTSALKVAFASTTRTISTPATWYLTTVTTTLPTPTYYQACGFRNRAPPPELQSKYWTSTKIIIDDDEPIIYSEGQGNAYDCCVSCWTLPASKGKCVGSVWRYIGPWGAPTCDWQNDENCGITDPDDPTGACYLILEAKKGVCRRHVYSIYGPTFADWPLVVSNGPGCLRWKFDGFGW